MPKVVINSEPGGFDLSHHALMLYGKFKNLNMQVYCKSGNNTYEIYKKKVGVNTRDYLLFHCVLPSGELFPENVDENFLKKYLLQLSDFSFLVQNDGRQLLRDFRSDPILVQIVQDLDELASGEYSSLKVVDVPDDVIWEIWTFDSGSEIVKEVSREWR